MRRIPLLLSLICFGIVPLTMSACGGGSSSSSSGGSGTVVAGSLKDASRADLSGQESVFKGTLGSGTSFTFPAIKGQSYFLKLDLDDKDDAIVVEFAGDDNSGLRSKTMEEGETFEYKHENKSQHVLVLVRPRNPFNTDIGIASLTITGRGTFADDTVHINFVIAGKHSGLGLNNDLLSTADQAAFTNALMQKVQTNFAQVGISLTFEGFAYTADQIKAQNPSLIGPDDVATCVAGESTGSNGFEIVQTQGLDAWGELGFASTDTSFSRGHGINVFLVHHFSQDGTVGLSPRPGTLVGKGADTALCVASFLQQGTTLSPRSLDEMALVTTHEIGHFLGLLHTTTFSPDPKNVTEAIDDGVKDTPKCTVTQDFNSDGRVGIGDGCPDETNIMFYQSEVSLQTLFSAGQGQIMRNLLSLQEH
jgi:hypothetical protein